MSRKTIAALVLAGGALIPAGVATAAFADDATSGSSQTIVVPADGDGSTVIVSSAVSNTAGNSDCIPADVAARFPFLPGPVC